MDATATATARTERRTYRCGCGRRMSRHAKLCNACHAKRTAELIAEARVIVATGKCPTCGTELVRNLAIAGWWQCGAYASESHRRPEFRGLPSCSFQTFTE